MSSGLLESGPPGFWSGGSALMPEAFEMVSKLTVPSSAGPKNVLSKAVEKSLSVMLSEGTPPKVSEKAMLLTVARISSCGS